MRLMIIVSALGLSAGCAQYPTAGGDEAHPILKGAWLVEDVDNGGVIDNAEVTIEFSADGKLSGKSACNRYGGDYAYDRGVLTAGPLFSTKMACAPALMDLEAKFLGRLEGELRASSEADGVVVLSNDKGRLLIRPAT